MLQYLRRNFLREREFSEKQKSPLVRDDAQNSRKLALSNRSSFQKYSNNFCNVRYINGKHYSLSVQTTPMRDITKPLSLYESKALAKNPY